MGVSVPEFGTGSGAGKQDYDATKGTVGQEIRHIRREDARTGINPPTFSLVKRDKRHGAIRGLYYHRAVHALGQRSIRAIRNQQRDYGEHVHWEHRILPTSSIWVDVHSNQCHQVENFSWKYLIRLTDEETGQVELFGSDRCNSESIDSCISQLGKSVSESSTEQTVGRGLEIVANSVKDPNRVGSSTGVKSSFERGERRRAYVTSKNDRRKT